MRQFIKQDASLTRSSCVTDSFSFTFLKCVYAGVLRLEYALKLTLSLVVAYWTSQQLGVTWMSKQSLSGKHNFSFSVSSTLADQQHVSMAAAVAPVLHRMRSGAVFSAGLLCFGTQPS